VIRPSKGVERKKVAGARKTWNKNSKDMKQVIN
jgi:hypothetical protein